MRYYIGFALITPVIDQENSGHPLNQSDVKLKKVTWLRTFPVLAGLFLFWVYTGSFFRKISKKKIPSSVRTRPFKNVRSIFYAVFKCYDKLSKDFCLLFSLMLYHFFRIKSHSFFFLLFFFFLLLQMAWRCFVTWQRMNRCSPAEETINLMCIGSWRKQTSMYCLTARVA